MPQASFAAQVEAWVAQSKVRMTAVMRESAQRVISDMQRPEGAGGRMPVVFGFLRASLQASIGTPANAMTQRPIKGQTYEFAAGEVALVIAGAELGDTIYATYGAAYARRLEYGFVGQDSLGRTYNQAGRAFVRTAAAKWPQIVGEVTAELKARLNQS